MGRRGGRRPRRAGAVLVGALGGVGAVAAVAAVVVVVVGAGVGVAGCSRTVSPGRPDAAPTDAARDAPGDADSVGCATGAGESGTCLATAECSALGAHTSMPGYCPGPADVQCCVVTPNVADNPPIPVGYVLMAQANVTPEMTAWAVAILHDPVTYPMFSTATMTFGSQLVLARVEWHPPDFQNSVIHRGVTLYQPA